MPTPSSIHLNELTRSYGGARGVENISLDVPEGSLFGFLGPNGAGKTTTIRVLLGFLRPTGGRALVLGHDAWSESPRVKAEVGYLPGDLRLYPWLTAYSGLSLFGAIRRRDLLRHGLELCQDFELDPSVPVQRMSRGTKQKLGLVLALAPQPRLLILDEPSSALDPLVQERLRARLRQAAAAGRTVFFSSHTLSEVESLCDRVAILRAGRLVEHGTLDTLRRAAGHEVTIKLVKTRTAASLSPPVGLRLDSVDGTLVRGSFHGELPVLLQWLGRQELDDVTVVRPDLESIFHRFYNQAGGDE